jgi:hypothetical protein
MKYYDHIRIVDKYLDGEGSIEKNTIYELINRYTDVRSYFFKNLQDPSIFNDLKDQGWFAPLTIKESDGNSLFWNVLYYLEGVSKQLDVYPQLAIEFMKIINDVVKYSHNKRKINNYHIWWYCVKILNNIPNDFVAKYLADTENESNFQFKEWLSEWLNKESSSDLTISDISEKLLPKFLDDSRTVPLADVIIDTITDIKKSKTKNYFTKDYEVLLKWQPYWIIKSLKQQAEKIGQVCGKEIIFSIANKLKRVLECKQESSYVVLHADNDVYRLSVRRQQINSQNEEEINYDPKKYFCKLEQYSDQQVKKQVEKSDYWYLHHNSPDKTVKHKEEIEFSNLDEFKVQVKEYLSTEIDLKKIRDYKKKIKNLYRNLFEDYSQVWFKSIEKGGSDHVNRAEEVLTIILRDIVIAKYKNDIDAGRQNTDVFLSGDYPFPIFKKLAVYCIYHFWDKDNMQKFKDFVKLQKRALDKPDWEVEVFDILKNYNVDFDEELIRVIKENIEDVPEYYKKDKNMAAQWQFNLLSPLKDNKNFKNLYEQVKKKLKNKKGYTPDRTAMGVRSVAHVSPLNTQEIKEKPNSDLVRYLQEYKGADSWHGTFEGKPDREGLANALQVVVKENPKKFTDEMDLFYDTPYYYVHHIMRGLRDAWSANKELDWEKILPFCQKFLQRPNFMEEAMKGQGRDSGKGQYVWFIEDVVNLIKIGVSPDKRAFEKEYFSQVWQIFYLIDTFLKEDPEKPPERDALTFALNTTLGKVIESFIYFSLRVAKIENQKPKNFSEKYNQFFKKGVEAYVWFGRYLPNINYLDSEFAQEKIKELSKPDDFGINWQCFMEGYLKGSYVYDELYSSMRPNYIKTIRNPILDDWANRRLAQHIAVWYLREKETIDEKDSLFRLMLEDTSSSEKKQRWFELVSFFWSLSKRTLKGEGNKDKPSQKTMDRILAFWKWTFDKPEFVKERLEKEYNSFLGKLAQLTILLPKLDKKAEKLLMRSAPHVERHHEATFFIEYLTQYEQKKELERIGRIYLKMLENTTPTFREEDIYTIVRRMYETNDSRIKEYADEICNKYGRRGIHFLKDLYFEFN